METMVKLNAYQELPSSDLMAMQEYVQTALDAVVAELLFDEGRFSYLAVTKSGPMEIAVGTGRYFNGGRAYRKGAATTHGLVSLVPSQDTRVVLVTVSGQSAETEPATRKFLVDATSRLTQPRPVATRIVREAVIGLVAGAAAVTPAAPPVPAGAIVVASLVLGPAGIVGEIAMEEANRALRLEQVVADVIALRQQDEKFSSQIANLVTQILSLRSELSTKAPAAALATATKDLADLKTRVGIAVGALMTGSDDFGNEDGSDPAFPGYAAEIELGVVTLAEEEASARLIEPLNPNDSNLRLEPGGLTLPKVAGSQVVLANLAAVAELPIANYPVTTTELRQQTLTKSYRWYYGSVGKKPFKDTLAYLKTLQTLKVYDPATAAYTTLNLNGADWELQDFGSDGVAASGTYRIIKVSTPYWSVGETTVNVTGARIAQTFVAPESGWYSSVLVGFTKVGPAGDVHLMLCRLTEAGTPDPSRVLARTTVPAAQLKTWTKGATANLTAFQVTPTFLAAGERAAIVLATTGNHAVGTSSAATALTQGLAMVSADGGAFWQAEVEKDLCLSLVRLTFASPSTTVTLKDVTLPGGIRKLFAAFTGWEPPGTAMQIEAQVDGQWRVVGAGDETILAGAPTQAPLRIRMSGTTAVQPAFDRTASRVVASRPKTPSVHVSTPRELPAGLTASKVTVDLVLVGFDPAVHTVAVAILHGPGHATDANAAPGALVALPGGDHRQAFTASGLPAIADYRIRITMTTSDPGRTFGVTERRDVAE